MWQDFWNHNGSTRTHAHIYIYIYIYKYLHTHCSICKWWIHVCETSMINLGILNLAVHEVNRRCHLLSLPQLDLFLWNLGHPDIHHLNLGYGVGVVGVPVKPIPNRFFSGPPHRKKTPLGALWKNKPCPGWDCCSWLPCTVEPRWATPGRSDHPGGSHKVSGPLGGWR